MKDLHHKLLRLNGKGYGAYKDLASRSWRLGDFQLEWIHIQGDPHASPSRLRVKVRLADLGIPPRLADTPQRQVAVADFLIRRLEEQLRADEGAQGVISIAEIGPEILRRNTSRIEGDALVQILMIALPGDGRRIEAEEAVRLLLQKLPDILTGALYIGNFPLQALERHVRCYEVQQALRAELRARGWVAFIADGSVLPREGGGSVKPLAGAVPFKAPPQNRVTLHVLGEDITGMPVPRGVTVIAGGAYHGKSTLLAAIERGIYDHVPGDGRERVVALRETVKIAVEEGRRVNGTDISLLFREFPGKNVDAFHTSAASGSTSQVANLVEALSCGAEVLLVDEDASAVNFLVRDARMRMLVRDENEPLIPLIQRIRDLKEQGISLVLVIGSCGDYLDMADTVLVMRRWLPEIATDSVAEIISVYPRVAWDASAIPWRAPQAVAVSYWRQLYKEWLKPSSAVEKQVKIRVQGSRVHLGRLTAEVGRLPQWAGNAQIRAAAFLVLRLLLEDGMQGKTDERLRQWCDEIETRGFDSRADSLDMSLPRPEEIYALLCRLEVKNQG